MDLASLYIKIDSSGVVTASKDLDTLAGKSKAVTSATSSMNTNFEKFKTHWMGVTVAVAAFAVAMNKAIQYMELGAKALQVESSFKIMTEASRISGNAMIANMKAATRQTIDDSALMAKAIKMMVMGYDSKQIERFSKNVVVASQIAGVSVEEAYEQMADAIANKMPRALLKMGAITKEQMKVVTEAVASGADEMALYKLAMANLELRTLQLQGTQDEATMNLQRFHKEVSETKEEIGKGLVVAMQVLWGVFRGIGMASLYATAGMWKLLQARAAYKEFTAGDKGLAAAWHSIGKEYEANSAADMRTAASMAYKEEKPGERATQSQISGAGKNVQNEFNKIKTANELAQAAGKLKEEIEKTTKAYNDLMGQISPVIAYQNEYTAGVKVLTDAFNIGLIPSLAQLNNEIGKFGAKLDEKVIDKIKSIDVGLSTISFGEDMGNGINAVASSLQNLTEIYEKQTKAIKDLNEQREIANTISDPKSKAEALAAVEQKELDIVQAQLGGYRKMASAASQYFAENSKERKALHNIEMVFAGIEMAMSMKKMATELFGIGQKVSATVAATPAIVGANEATAISGAASSITAAGSGDPYTGIGRVVAMMALMAAVLGAAGIAFMGGGSSSASTPLPKSTVLGAADGTGSESAQNAYKLLEDTYDLTDTKLTRIYNELKNLNANITGLVTSIVRTGGVSTAGMNLNLDYVKGASRTFWEGQSTPGSAAFMINNFITSGLSNIVNQLPLMKWLTNFLGGLGEKIFGGGTKSKVIGTGIAIGDTLIKNIMDGMDISAQQYAKVKKTKSGGIFGSDKVSYYKVYSTLNDDVTDMLTLVFKNIGSTLVMLSQELGTNTQDVLNYVFKASQINLQGMTTEQMNKALSEYISNISDTAVNDLFGYMLKSYQKLNEGLLETAVRLIRDKVIVQDILGMTNQSFSGTITEVIKFSEEIIALAGDITALQDAATGYFDKFFSDTEKQNRLHLKLSEVFESMNMVLPETRVAYRLVLEGLDLTTASGKEAYVTLLQLAGVADDYYTYLAEAQQKLVDAQSDIVDTFLDYVNKLKTARESLKLDGKNLANENATARLAFNAVLSQARLGDFSGIGTLDKTLSTLVSGANSTKGYSSELDYKRNFYQTYGMIAELEGLTNNQLSIEQQTYDILKSQLDVLQNIDANMAALTGGSSVQGFAEGGISSGPESGYQARLHGTELVVSPKKSYSANVKSNDSGVAEEIRKLREEMKAQNYAIAKNTGKTASVLDRFDNDGMPAERVI